MSNLLTKNTLLHKNRCFVLQRGLKFCYLTSDLTSQSSNSKDKQKRSFLAEDFPLTSQELVGFLGGGAGVE